MYDSKALLFITLNQIRVTSGKEDNNRTTRNGFGFHDFLLLVILKLSPTIAQKRKFSVIRPRDYHTQRQYG